MVNKRHLVSAAREFATTELGPESQQLVALEEIQAKLAWRVRTGTSIKDAVLAEVYEAGSSNRRLADEFMGFFFDDLLRSGHHIITPELRRHHDTHDLVLSVAGNLWEIEPSFRYRSRGQFLAYLKRRMGWKRANYFRSLQRRRQREDKLCEHTKEAIASNCADRSPHSLLSSREDAARLTLALSKLPPDQGRALKLAVMRGQSMESVARELGITGKQASKLVARAKMQVKNWMWRNR